MASSMLTISILEAMKEFLSSSRVSFNLETSGKDRIIVQACAQRCNPHACEGQLAEYVSATDITPESAVVLIALSCGVHQV
jgi:hypothetical protein